MCMQPCGNTNVWIFFLGGGGSNYQGGGGIFRAGENMNLQILLPSAVHLEERLTVSQSVPEPASRQSDRYTQFGFFVSGRCGTKQQGGPAQRAKYWLSGNAADAHPCGRRFNPSLPTFAPPPAAALKVSGSGFEPWPANLVPAALPLDRLLCYQWPASPLLVAY